MKKILENANYKLQDGVRTCASFKAAVGICCRSKIWIRRLLL